MGRRHIQIVFAKQLKEHPAHATQNYQRIIKLIHEIILHHQGGFSPSFSYSLFNTCRSKFVSEESVQVASLVHTITLAAKISFSKDLQQTSLQNFSTQIFRECNGSEPVFTLPASALKMPNTIQYKLVSDQLPQQQHWQQFCYNRSKNQAGPSNLRIHKNINTRAVLFSSCLGMLNSCLDNTKMKYSHVLPLS